MHLTADSRILIQGIMEPLGQAYVPWMKAYGSPIVAGVSPAYGGVTRADIPVYDLVEQAVAAVGAIDTTVICTQPYAVLDAALEAIAAHIRQIILLTEGVPPLDMVRLIQQAEATETLVIGPNSPGVIIPGQILLGTYPSSCYMPGRVGIISRSSTLTFEVGAALTQAQLGQSICVGLGSDAITGSTFSQWLQLLEEDEQTDVIVLIGETGGDAEEKAAAYIQAAIDKPVVAYIAGRHVPRGSYIGHLGAIIAAQAADPQTTNLDDLDDSTLLGTAQTKIAALQQAHVAIADRPSQVPVLVQQALAGRAAEVAEAAAPPLVTTAPRSQPRRRRSPTA